jgi:hypothetical protein
VKRLARTGAYYRVFKPEWADPLDTTPSKLHGGRWNAPGSFGNLYLARDTAVAAAIARAQHAGRAVGLFDLQAERRPHLLQVEIPPSADLDVVSSEGIRALHLPARYPFGVGHQRCQPIGLRAYRSRDFVGIACRSAAECQPGYWVGEELAWFDSSPPLEESGPRRDFASWYPDPIP